MTQTDAEKAQWRKKDWAKSSHPEREDDYEMFEELATASGVIGQIEQFAANPRCFYANVAGDRSGCLGSADLARQWVETKTGNKVN